MKAPPKTEYRELAADSPAKQRAENDERKENKQSGKQGALKRDDTGRQRSRKSPDTRLAWKHKEVVMQKSPNA